MFDVNNAAHLTALKDEVNLDPAGVGYAAAAADAASFAFL